MRIASVAVLIACLAACKSANQTQNNDAVRQGVLAYLQKGGYNVAGMDVSITDVKYNGNGNQADAKVNIGVKGSGTTAMSMGYHLEMKDNQWTVVGKQDASQHGATAPPPDGGAAAGGAPENPHAGGVPGAAPAGGGKMPSPEDLPPAGKKK